MLYCGRERITELDENNGKSAEKGKYKKMCDLVGEAIVNKITTKIKKDIYNYINNGRLSFNFDVLKNIYGWEDVFEKLAPLETYHRKRHDIGLIIKQILIDDTNKWDMEKESPIKYTKK